MLFIGVSAGQTPAPVPKDPLGRDTPQDAILQFLEVCHARNYAKAQRYLDLRGVSSAQQAKSGTELAHQLEDLLDDTPFDITRLSRDPEGDLYDDLPPDLERLETFQLGAQSLELKLRRVQVRPDSQVWLVSADSLPLIPKAHQLIHETAIEKKLPQVLVTNELFDTPLWRWLALVLGGALIWGVSGLLAKALVTVLRGVKSAQAFRGPVRIVFAVLGFRAAMDPAAPATLARLFLERTLEMVLALAIAWAGVIVVDLLAHRWQTHLDPRVQAVSYSVLPLGRQVARLLLFLIAILTVISSWGYNTSTIVAGLGVGGLAFALAAQKTIENLFGGISVIGDRPVLVGDFCRFGDRVGTVVHIGLRSTRIRTLDRTMISVPNAQFSSMELENFTQRDKIWFHQTLSLRRNTTSKQLLQVVSSVEEILRSHPRVETGNLPVRFVGLGSYSLNIEVFAYVRTSDYDEFLGLQQELLLKILQAVEDAGTTLAVPVQEQIALRVDGKASEASMGNEVSSRLSRA